MGLPENVETELPDYANELDAFHRAYRAELQRVIDDLPLRPGDRVLDVACGDGVYSAWLAGRVGQSGSVVALDASKAYLDVARANPDGRRIAHVAGAMPGLPMRPASFDLVWCAQSFMCFQHAVEALVQLRRMAKPGGYVAVMESDSLHQLMLPWPEYLELAVRQAELEAACESGWTDNRYIGRHLPRLFRAAGLTPVHCKTYAIDRRQPLADPEQAFIRRHLRRLGEIASPYLTAAMRKELRRHIAPESPDYMLRQPDFAMTWLDVVCCGQRLHPAASRRARKATDRMKKLSPV